MGSANINKVKKLEKEVKKKDFSTSYKEINTFSKFISVLGNIGSILAASFFMYKLLGNLIENQIVVAIITGVVLVIIELVKRMIFNKFSLEFIRYKYSLLHKEVLILFIMSISIITISFYSSLNGAQEFSNRNEQIEEKMTVEVSTFSDSIRTEYQPKIDMLNDDILAFRDDIKEKDDELTRLNSVLEERGWLSSSERNRIKDLRSEIDYLRAEIPKRDDKIEEINVKINEKIDTYESSLTEDITDDKKKNNTNSLVFVLFSTIIEFTILIGIFFSKFYSYKSYQDLRKRKDKDPKYQKWLVYNEILEIIYMNDAIIGDRIETQKNIIEFAKMNDVYVSKNELSEFFKLLNALNIAKTNGPYKYIQREKEEAQDLISKYFKI